MSSKNKHLTMEDREEIKGCLDHGMNFKAIAARVSKDPTTVSKEVKKHAVVRSSGAVLRAEDGSVLACPKLMKAPFVCNGCKKRYNCGYEKRYYLAKPAHEEYKALLTEAREGTPLNKESFYRADDIITTCVKQGQHIYHITQTHNLGMSKSTVYRHINDGYLSVGKMDLPRAVKFKPRKKKKEDSIPSALKKGRTYEDFLTFIQENDIADWVEMDTVIGEIGGKVILTMDFTFCNFMFGLLLDNKTAFETAQKISSLKDRLKKNGVSFGDTFPVILTDNGSEFSNVFAIENNAEGVQESRLYFCHPYRSSEKPHVEKNHTLFRDIVPKGTSFENLTQENVNTIFSHVNAVKRKRLHGKSPYDMFCFTYGAALAELLGIEYVKPENVIQSPLLLRQLKV